MEPQTPAPKRPTAAIELNINAHQGERFLIQGHDFWDSYEYSRRIEKIFDAQIGDQYFSGRTVADGGAKSLAQEDDGKERHRLIQRHNVIKELVDTEAVFVRDMNIVEEIYKGTAEACPKLDSKTVKLIFRNSDEIIQFHTYFLRGLKEASNVESMKLAHEGFLRNSDQAAKRLIQIQQDPTVQVWLNECNEVAKDLTAAWDLDSLLIKPMQRITKYPNLIITLLQHTPQDHPDREALLAAKDSLETAIVEINRTKKNFELVGQIVGRKRKESDVKAGFARAFGKRVDKLQASNNRPPEDQDYAKLHEKFGDDYLRLQVVLRDVEFYTRQVSAYVHEFLQYLSSVELVMRLQPGNYPELESKWVQFNISVRDLEKVALEEHLTQVRKHVIEPFELVIKAYGNPSLAMKKRQKRRLDYERSEQLKRSGRTADPKLRELVEQYEALNDTLKKELPTLSALTEKVGNICLGNFVNIQTDWYAIWKEKMKTVLGDCPEIPDLEEVVSTFQRDYPYARDQLASIGILNPTSWGRLSQSTTSMDDSTIRSRGRGHSVNGDAAPTLPAPDFGGRRSGSFSMSPSPSATGLGGAMSSPHHYYYRDYYAGIHAHQGAPASSSRSPEMVGSSRSLAGTGAASTRPSTGRSLDSGGAPRQSSESATQHRRDSNTTYNSGYLPHESRRYSNIFHSALPLPDGPEDSRRSSRASSRERNQTSDGYNILWLAASLFEFNISTTKHEAGYPYLTYQAGEIFDVIAEKGELWLAKNQDDATDQVGWIWSKHFAKLADS
ncbi:rhoGEF domain-containing protein [Hirsutella rhossiliensis]|uniref:RhoGEF domain-containing protein n=1 Tax=Hirsutella rhossiliensis TaxID=111463 RepID=A0A9P8SLA8_9HYPO|nr:rhoGEF domain-containing protein [Hirsutella rhossiliensis]KAH0967278.1 rhoGEF domain-containing protein [Hirsutella rhossiliensis]